MLVCVLLFSFVSLVKGIPITTRQKSQNILRNDRMDYALSEDKDVYAAKFLKRFGYMGEGVKVNRLSKNKLLEALEIPLKRFQRYHGIKATGNARFPFDVAD